MKNPYLEKANATAETFVSARRMKLAIDLNEHGDNGEGVTAVTLLLISILEEAEKNGYHGAEIEIFTFKKEN